MHSASSVPNTRGIMIDLVVPVMNEESNIPILAREIELMATVTPGINQCIWVDDGSTDDSWKQISNLSSFHRGIRLGRNYGQSTAIMAGIDSSHADWICTLDSDLQNDPSDIPRLLGLISEEVDVVTGIRMKRKDKFFSRRLPSYFANLIARRLLNVKITDAGCTLRIFRRRLLSETRLVGEMHRVLIYHFAVAGARIIELPVNHRERVSGTSKYGINRTFKFVADIILVKSLRQIMDRPLYFFGRLSLYSLLSALALGISAIALRILSIKSYIDGTLMVGALTLGWTSLSFFCLGLIVEVIIRLMIGNNNGLQYEIDSRSK